MGSVNIVALNRARTTFQRVSDAKFFNGWIKHISLGSVLAHTHTGTRVEPGDEFSFQVYGNGMDAFFCATLTALYDAEGTVFSTDRSGDATAVELECRLSTEMVFKESTGQPRFCIEGACADVRNESGHEMEGAIIIDIGPGGLQLLPTGNSTRVTVCAFRSLLEGSLLSATLKCATVLPTS